MRLIDADALYRFLMEKSEIIARGTGRNRLVLSCKAVAAIVQDVPTIDAVPVVRCKDCKHFADDYVDTGFGPVPAFSCDVCELYGARLSLNHYCAYGEREDDETD